MRQVSVYLGDQERTAWMGSGGRWDLVSDVSHGRGCGVLEKQG